MFSGEQFDEKTFMDYWDVMGAADGDGKLPLSNLHSPPAHIASRHGFPRSSFPSIPSSRLCLVSSSPAGDQSLDEVELGWYLADYAEENGKMEATIASFMEAVDYIKAKHEALGA